MMPLDTTKFLMATMAVPKTAPKAVRSRAMIAGFCAPDAMTAFFLAKTMADSAAKPTAVEVAKTQANTLLDTILARIDEKEVIEAIGGLLKGIDEKRKVQENDDDGGGTVTDPADNKPS